MAADTNRNQNDKMKLSRQSPKAGRLELIEAIITKSIFAVNAMAVPPTPRTLTMAATAWGEVMECIPTGELEAAYRKAMQIRGDKGITFPLGAPEIVAAWKEQRKPAILTSSEAWAIVVAEVHRVHYDGKPEFDDPLVAKVVKQLGWHFLCMNETAATRFEWAWKEEANAYSEKLELDPNYQLPGMESNKLLRANAAAMLADSDVTDAEKESIAKVMEIFG